MSNTVRIVQKTRADLVNLDMEYLGKQLMLDPNKVARVVRKFAGDDSFVGFFSKFGIGVDESSPSVSQDTYDELIYRWRVNINQVTPLTIRQSNLPAVIRAGDTFTLGVDDGWVMADAILMTEDSTVQLLVIRRTADVEYMLDVQYISWDRANILTRKELLSVGRKLNYQNNAKGERSTTSQEFKGTGSYELANITTTSRHKLSASGHGLSNAIWTAYETLDGNGKRIPEESGWLPMRGETLRKHFMHMSMQMWAGRTNFNPQTSKIVNINPYNENGQEVPIGSGAQEQMETTENVGEFEINARPGDRSRFLDNVLGQMFDYHRTRKPVALVGIMGAGGKAWVAAAMEEKRIRSNQQIHIVDNGSSGNHAGMTNTEYITDFGKLTILNVGNTKPRGHASEQVMFNGRSYDLDGFNMYFMPIYLSEEDQTRYNFRIVTKKKGNLSRGLVIGNLKGMSGLYNSTGIDGLASSVGNAQIAQSAYESGFDVASPVDGETMMALSEYMVVMDTPDDVYWARPIA